MYKLHRRRPLRLPPPRQRWKSASPRMARLYYHYHTLPLRSLIIAIDPASQSSPKANILDLFSSALDDFDKAYWDNEAYYMPPNRRVTCHPSDNDLHRDKCYKLIGIDNGILLWSVWKHSRVGANRGCCWQMSTNMLHSIEYITTMIHLLRWPSKKYQHLKSEDSPQYDRWEYTSRWAVGTSRR